MWNISVKRGFVATDVFKVMYGLIHNHMRTGCVTHLITQTVTVFCEAKVCGAPGICFPGYKLAEECTAPGRRSKCIPCPSDQYRDTINFDKNCRKCKSCKSTVQWSLPQQIRFPCLICSGWMTICCLALFFFISTTPGFEVMVSPCERTQNTVCRCQDGYYKLNFSSQDYTCYRCKTCELNEKEIQKCEPSNKP